MNVYTLTELRALPIPDPEPIIEGLLNAGETILLVGRPKIGKSRLVQQATLDLAHGRPFLGRFRIPHPRRVLLIDLENRPGVVKARFARMSAPNQTADDRITVYPPDTLASGGIDATQTGINALRVLVVKSAPDVLIIDTWRLFVAGDENDSRVTVDALKSLSQIRLLRPQLAIIIVHHLRKDKGNGAGVVRLREDAFTWVESVSGHHALVGHVDACFGLEREPDSGNGESIVFGGVARNATTSLLLLDEDDQTLQFNVKSGSDAAISVMTAAELAIWNSPDRLKRFTFTELMKAAGTNNRKAVSSMLRKAEAHGANRKDGNTYVAA